MDATLGFAGTSIQFCSFGHIMQGLVNGSVVKATRISWPKERNICATKPIRINGHHDNVNAEVIHGEEQPSHSVLVRHLMVSIGSELFEPYSPTQSDMFAQDWIVVK